MVKRPLSGTGAEDASGTGSVVDSFLREVARTPEIVGRLAIGRTIGRYQVKALLGRGGMGCVYEAEDVELGRRVALKLLRPELEGEAADKERFLRERKVTAELEHPAIVAVYDSGVSSEGEPYYVMRIARGEPLDRLIARAGSLEERLALLPNLVAVVEAVAFAHSRGIVHRDLKPSNVLVGAFGETLVADWGIAKRLATGVGKAEAVETHPAQSAVDVGDAASESATRAGAAIGTPAYMSPEQAEGRPIDERADVYALGKMLEQLIAGPGDTGAIRDLRAIARKAASVDRDARYARAADLGEELRRVQTGQIVEARAYTRSELLVRWAQRPPGPALPGGCPRHDPDRRDRHQRAAHRARAQRRHCCG